MFGDMSTHLFFALCLFSVSILSPAGVFAEDAVIDSGAPTEPKSQCEKTRDLLNEMDLHLGTAIQHGDKAFELAERSFQNENLPHEEVEAFVAESKELDAAMERAMNIIQERLPELYPIDSATPLRQRMVTAALHTALAAQIDPIKQRYFVLLFAKADILDCQARESNDPDSGNGNQDVGKLDACISEKLTHFYIERSGIRSQEKISTEDAAIVEKLERLQRDLSGNCKIQTQSSSSVPAEAPSEKIVKHYPIFKQRLLAMGNGVRKTMANFLGKSSACSF